MTLAELRAQRIRLVVGTDEAGRPPGGAGAPVTGDLLPVALCRCGAQIRWVDGIVPVEATARPAPRPEYTLAEGGQARRWIDAGERCHVPHPCAWAPRLDPRPERSRPSAVEARRAREFDLWRQRWKDGDL